MEPFERDEPSELDLDKRLRERLEPNPFTVERLVRNALDGRPSPVRSVWWPRLAVGAALLVLVVLFFPTAELGPPPGGETRSSAPQRPTRLSISNEDGLVTVTSPAGSKMIILSGDK